MSSSPLNWQKSPNPTISTHDTFRRPDAYGLSGKFFCALSHVLSLPLFRNFLLTPLHLFTCSAFTLHPITIPNCFYIAHNLSLLSLYKEQMCRIIAKIVHKIRFRFLDNMLISRSFYVHYIYNYVIFLLYFIDYFYRQPCSFAVVYGQATESKEFLARQRVKQLCGKTKKTIL